MAPSKVDKWAVSIHESRLQHDAAVQCGAPLFWGRYIAISASNNDKLQDTDNGQRERLGVLDHAYRSRYLRRSKLQIREHVGASA
jgi:hypothetical protein